MKIYIVKVVANFPPIVINCRQRLHNFQCFQQLLLRVYILSFLTVFFFICRQKDFKNIFLKVFYATFWPLFNSLMLPILKIFVHLDEIFRISSFFPKFWRFIRCFDEIYSRIWSHHVIGHIIRRKDKRAVAECWDSFTRNAVCSAWNTQPSRRRIFTMTLIILRITMNLVHLPYDDTHILHYKYANELRKAGDKRHFWFNIFFRCIFDLEHEHRWNRNSSI